MYCAGVYVHGIVCKMMAQFESNLIRKSIVAPVLRLSIGLEKTRVLSRCIHTLSMGIDTIYPTLTNVALITNQ